MFPSCTRDADGIAAKLLRCGIASEALRRNMPLSSQGKRPPKIPRKIHPEMCSKKIPSPFCRSLFLINSYCASAGTFGAENQSQKCSTNNLRMKKSTGVATCQGEGLWGSHQFVYVRVLPFISSVFGTRAPWWQSAFLRWHPALPEMGCSLVAQCPRAIPE